ncbi:MAG: hypothetical protein ABIB71_07140 [Candidatus Woesearchaeota archaeon]
MELMLSVMGILAFGAVVGLAAIFFARKKRPADYYAFFLMGLVWLIGGSILKNYVLAIFGTVFSIVGMLNKAKWKSNRLSWADLDKRERFFRLAVVVVLGFLVFGGIVFSFLYGAV